MLYRLARPLLFALDAERSHDLALAALRDAHAAGLTRLLRPALPDDPVRLMGLTFRNPVGLAAGLDKNGAFVDPLGDMGFGFIEVGTVTPKPQPGNARPRLFRLPDAEALINRFGFNNVGVDRFVQNVERQTRFSAAGGVLGLNIGKNALTPNADAVADYGACLDRVYPLLTTRAGYVTVNVSSPNTRNLRDLQQGAELAALLAGLRSARERLADAYGKRVPLAVKIAPDLDDSDLCRIADALVAHGIDAVIATNTTTSRDGVGGSAVANEAGGMSGRPLRDRATHAVALLASHLRGALPVIGVGGILSGEDAVARLQAGASAIQLYTGLIFRGPGLVAECRRAVRDYRARMSGSKV